MKMFCLISHASPFLGRIANLAQVHKQGQVRYQSRNNAESGSNNPKVISRLTVGIASGFIWICIRRISRKIIRTLVAAVFIVAVVPKEHYTDLLIVIKIQLKQRSFHCKCDRRSEVFWRMIGDIYYYTDESRYKDIQQQRFNLRGLQKKWNNFIFT